MGSPDVPAELREKLEQRMRDEPRQAPVIARLLDERAAAASAEERARIDAALEILLGRRRRLGAWIALGAVALSAPLGLILHRQVRVEQAVVEGTPMPALVERMEPWSCLAERGDVERCLSLTVNIHPPTGAPYSVSIEQAIPLEWMARVQPGSWLTVSVSRTDPQQVVVDVGRMALPPPAPPPSVK